jgi:hypothetical protein
MNIKSFRFSGSYLKYVRERNLKTKIFTVDVVGGIIFVAIIPGLGVVGHPERKRRPIWPNNSPTTADSFDTRLQMF